MSNTLTKLLATGVATAGLLLAGSPATAGDQLAAAVSLDIVSKYVWRGQLLTDDPVVQGGLTLSKGGLALNIWASVDTSDVNEAEQAWRLQEVDYTLSYSASPVAGLDLSGGVIRYDFPGTVFTSTTELFATASLSKLPLTPTLEVYYDVDQVNGFYLNASLGHSFSLTEQLSLDLTAGLGWGDHDYNSAYFGVATSAWNDAKVGASLSYAFNSNCSIAAYLTYSSLIDTDIDASQASDSDLVYGGLNASYAF